MTRGDGGWKILHIEIHPPSPFLIDIIERTKYILNEMELERIEYIKKPGKGKREKDEVSGVKKAAIFLVSLGSKLAGEVTKYLKDEEIEKLMKEIARIEKVTPEEKRQVLEEFQSLMEAQQFIQKGGIEYAREVLERALGKEKAEEILYRIKNYKLTKPFSFLNEIEPEQLVSILRNEHPQTIALILSYLKPEISAKILKSLEPHIQGEVIKRMAKIEKISPEIIKEIEVGLKRKIEELPTKKMEIPGGTEKVAQILNYLDSETSKELLSYVESHTPELADEIRDKMFVFDDIIYIEDSSLQKLMQYIDRVTLAKALKGADKKVIDKFLKNMSKRNAQILKEEIEYLGPLRKSEVEEARKEILNIIRELEEKGDIRIIRGGEEYIY